VPEENLLRDFMVQGEISEADTPTIQLGATLSGLISDPPRSSSIFTPDALPATTLPIYPGLEQAPNMLACIPSGLVHIQIHYSSNEHLIYFSKEFNQKNKVSDVTKLVKICIPIYGHCTGQPVSAGTPS